MKKILKVAIVGMGQAGLRHLSAFSKLKNVQIEGVADSDKNILKALPKITFEGRMQYIFKGKLRKLLKNKMSPEKK